MTGRVTVTKPARPEVRSVSLQVDPPDDGDAIVNVELAFTVPGTASRKLHELSLPAPFARELARRLMAAVPDAPSPAERRRFIGK